MHRRMKMRNKGKVYPSPSSSSTPTCDSNGDALSILKLLPAAILALASVLSLEDQVVLAYMITRSIKSANPSSIFEEKKKNNKKSNIHKPPLFDCECFYCYTSFWFRWDSSPNRELIHQAIEAFEEHLISGEQPKRSTRGKKREKMGRRAAEKPVPEREVDGTELDTGFVVVNPDSNIPLEVSPENGGGGGDGDEVETESPEKVQAPAPAETEMAEAEGEMAVVLRSSSANSHKGLVRKVLPDVVGILNSRLWSLWGPNV